MIILDLHTNKAVVKLQPEKNSDLDGIRTYDLCDTVAVLYQLTEGTLLSQLHKLGTWLRRAINYVFTSLSAVQIYDL